MPSSTFFGPIRISTFFLITSAALSFANCANAQAMEDLGVLPGGNISFGYGISGDGTSVVGKSNATGGSNYAFRWVDGTMESLGLLTGGAWSAAYGANLDGSVVVGYGHYFDGATNGSHAFRWVEGVGMQDLGALDNATYSQAYDVSDDGSIVVGQSQSNSGARAFRWVDGVGMTSLGSFDGVAASLAYATNSDGSVVVGISGGGVGGGTYAFRWTSAGMVSLGALDGKTWSNAHDVNNDGSVVVGVTQSNAGQFAFRWTDTGGMVSLGGLTGYTSSVARGVNADGTVVVGYSQGGGNEAFRWVEGEGMEALGYLTGGNQSYAEDVSDDGSIVVGYGNSTNGTRAFIYRTAMLDLANTQIAIGQSAFDQAAVVERRNTAMMLSLGRELEVARAASHAGSFSTKGAFGQNMPMAIRFEGGLFNNAESGSLQYGGLTAAFGITDNLTLGGFVLAGAEQSGLDGGSVAGDQTAFGIYMRSREADRSGLTWKLALAYSFGDVDITRSATLLDTEVGHGVAGLATMATSAEFGYGFDLGRTLITPFLRIARTSTTRGAYTEDADIDFPVTFDSHTQYLTTLTLGINGEFALSANDTIRFGLGLESDLIRSDNAVTGTSDVVGMTTFSVAGPAIINTTRAYASIGYSHAFSNGSRITFDGGLQQSAYTDTLTTSVSIGYEVRF